MKTLKINCLGYSILADWYEGTKTDEIILFLMGSTSTRNTGMSTLVIDYTGHGESPFDLGDTRPAEHLVESIAAYDWIAEQYPNANISVVSASYGAYLAANLIEFRVVEKLILLVPAIYRPEALYDLWRGQLQDEDNIAIDEYRHDIHAMKDNPIFVNNAKQFNGKTFVIVHSDDELIPQEVTDLYIEAFSADQYIAEGFKHDMSQSNPTEAQTIAYHSAISEWLNKA
jgi:alpha/beta superfamily hydrolase